MMIRQMETEDIPAVAEIERACFSQPWSEQGFLEGMKDAIFLVAEEEHIVGYIGMYQMPPEGEITNVAVAADYQNQGYGKALVKEMQQQAVAHGIDRIVLEVRAGNSGAVHVYESLGFHKLGVRKDFYQFPKEDADIMEWKQLC